MLFFLAVGESEDHHDSLLYFLFQFLLDGHLHYADHLDILFVQLELIIGNVLITRHRHASPRKRLHLFLLVVVIPVRILPTALVSLVFLS